MSSPALERCLAEFLGTGLLVGIGTGTIVAAGRIGGIPPWLMAVAWFWAVLIPIALCVRISGAHLNPAVTLALSVSGRVAWKEVPAYWGSQFGGAFLASLSVRLALGGGSRLGATVPVHIDAVGAFAAEAAFTALLVGAVFFVADRGEGRGRWRLGLPPAAVGVSTFLIGPRTGSSLNPARTVAPAVLSGTYTDLWVYLVAVPLAAVAVAAVWKPRSVDIQDRGVGRLTDPTREPGTAPGTPDDRVRTSPAVPVHPRDSWVAANRPRRGDPATPTGPPPTTRLRDGRPPSDARGPIGRDGRDSTPLTGEPAFLRPPLSVADLAPLASSRARLRSDSLDDEPVGAWTPGPPGYVEPAAAGRALQVASR